MFDDWCEIDEDDLDEGKTLLLLSERDGMRPAIQPELVGRIRSHYDRLENIEDDLEELGYLGAAAILAERLPTTPRARSAELGEILATEFMEYQTGFRFPVRRLRYKDGREMALRGDDFLGVETDDENNLYYLKGESKSGTNISRPVVNDARGKLSEYDGRPTPISLLFVTDRLLEADGEDRRLGRRIRNEVARRTIPASRITHALFTLWAQVTAGALREDLKNSDEAHPQLSAGFRIADHRQFIDTIYEEAANLGDD